jgi:hypothetical protein
MNIAQFKAVLVAADPAATHHFGGGTGNYTAWSEFGTDGLRANNRLTEHIHRIQVDRFTKAEADPVVDAITSALDAAEIAYEYQLDREPDTKYLHHIWDCEVV